MGSSTILRRSAWLVFAGALVVFLDFEINGFDLINDVIGAGLVVGGLWRLRETELEVAWLTPALATAVVWLALTVIVQFSPVSGPVGGLAGATGLAATIMGVLAFRDACRRLGLGSAESSWSTSLWLVVSIWGGLALVGLVLLVAAGGREVHYETLWALPVVILAFIPFVHLLVSLARTASAAEA